MKPLTTVLAAVLIGLLITLPYVYGTQGKPERVNTRFDFALETPTTSCKGGEVC